MNRTIAATPGIASILAGKRGVNILCSSNWNGRAKQASQELARYGTLRAWTTDEQVIKAIEQTIRDIENRLAAIDESSKPGDRRRR